MPTNTAPLTVAEVLRLGVIVQAANESQRVNRLDGDEIICGTARAIVRDSEHAYFATEKDDVRDCFLWVTTRSGFEAFWSVRELVENVARGEFSASAR